MIKIVLAFLIAWFINQKYFALFFSFYFEKLYEGNEKKYYFRLGSTMTNFPVLQ